MNPGNTVASKKEKTGCCLINRVKNNINPPPKIFYSVFYVSTSRRFYSQQGWGSPPSTPVGGCAW